MSATPKYIAIACILTAAMASAQDARPPITANAPDPAKPAGVSVTNPPAPAPNAAPAATDKAAMPAPAAAPADTKASAAAPTPPAPSTAPTTGTNPFLGKGRRGMFNTPATTLIRGADANKDGKISWDEVKEVLPHFPKERFDAMDTNKDGFLTEDELPVRKGPIGQGLERIIDRADADHDGKVTKSEFAQVFPQNAEKRFERLDYNKDGVLDEKDKIPGQDHPPMMQTSIKDADKNGDGKVSPEEYKAAHPNAAPDAFQKLDRNGDGFLDQNDKPNPADLGPMGPGKMLSAADTDHDGKITKEEYKKAFPNAPANRFDALDKNKDGVISGDEMPRRPMGRPGMELLQRADTNHDGKISMDEFKASFPNAPEARFKLLDTNGDGFISDADVPAGPPGGAKSGPAPTADELEKVLATDADKDGKVTFEEVTKAKPGYPRETFDKLDKNHDGVITRDDK